METKYMKITGEKSLFIVVIFNFFFKLKNKGNELGKKNRKQLLPKQLYIT
jgi:hypothetical protein